MSIQASAGIMGMPVHLNIVDAHASWTDAEVVFAYLRTVDCTFSTYKSDSETERINRHELLEKESSEEMQTIIALCETTRIETGGFFDARYQGRFDPSGFVKGYALQRAAQILHMRGFKDFFVEAGGDIQTSGHNSRGEKWRVGIRDPFKPSELVMVVHLSGEGIATSGTYERGEHIYDPVHRRPANEVASMSIIATGVYDADRFATAAFAMGRQGLPFIGALPVLHGFMVTCDGRAYCTPGFQRYTAQ